MMPRRGWRRGEQRLHACEESAAAAVRVPQTVPPPLVCRKPCRRRRAHMCWCRFLPLLRPRMVPYQLHLFAERTDADVQRVAQVIGECVRLCMRCMRGEACRQRCADALPRPVCCAGRLSSTSRRWSSWRRTTRWRGLLVQLWWQR